jgi:hypothetical protein
VIIILKRLLLEPLVDLLQNLDGFFHLLASGGFTCGLLNALSKCFRFVRREACTFEDFPASKTLLIT